jgi:hypothetical protein
MHESLTIIDSTTRICSASPRTNVTDIYTQQIANLDYAPASRTFSDWVSFSKKFARLVAGGSLYVLVVVAGLDLRWEVAKAPHEVAFQAGEMLRKPSRAKEGE